MPKDNGSTAGALRGAQTFDELYYREGCGPDPYERNDAWLNFYAQIVEHIIRSLAPRSVFDAGCALGMMVEAFWDRGIEAHGVDISEYAIANVRPDMREHCRVASLVEPIPRRYDLITCIEVLEHMPPEDAFVAVRNIADATDTVLFSSSPYDFEEVTHVNVRPSISWIRLFGEHGLWPDLVYDASFVLPHTMLLRRGEAPSDAALVAFVEKLRLQHELVQARRRLQQAEAKVAESAALGAEAERWSSERNELRSECDRLKSECHDLSSECHRLKPECHRLKVELDVARADLQTAKDALAAANDLVAQKSAEAAALRHSVGDAEQVRQRLAALEGSTTWRATAHLRAALSRLPAPMRRQLRRGARLGWWMITPHRTPERLRLLAERRAAGAVPGAAPASAAVEASRLVAREVVAASSLFDAEWYLEQYSDVAAAGLDPATHYAEVGAFEGRDPGPRFSTEGYLARYPDVARAGLNALVHYEEYGRADGLAISWSRLAEMTTADVVDDALGHLRPLPVFSVARGLRPRVTMVTDSIASNSFYGGVGTATILAALWAERRDATLRIATLRAEPVRDNVANLLRTLGVTPPEHIEFCYADLNAADRPLDVSAEDVFLTTSWWSTANVLSSIPVERIAYLLQEDERMFYPAGDDQLRAQEVMEAPGLRRIVNTRLLFDFLKGSGLRGLDTHGMWFEPAFPEGVYFPEPRPREKMNLFFYARPNNSRNLYLRGLEVLGAAVSKGVLRGDEWNVHFVGRDLQPVKLPGGLGVKLVENLSWDRYVAMLRGMDLGLSLMLTPHPSYPPLDIAACGGIAVTNTNGPKQSLAMYSENIICAEPAVDTLLDALAEGVALARDDGRRQANYARQGLQQSWRGTFAPVLDWIETG